MGILWGTLAVIASAAREPSRGKTWALTKLLGKGFKKTSREKPLNIYKMFALTKRAWAQQVLGGHWGQFCTP